METTTKPQGAGSAGEQRADERLCDNCGTSIRGAYCWRCGQPTRSFIKAMPAVVRDVANDTLSYDSRLWRTLRPLLFSPGFLSREYVSGRRARYSPPFRLYLVTSILAFLVVSFAIGTAGIGGNSIGPAGDSPPNIVFQGGQPWHLEDNPLEFERLGERGNAWLNRQVEKLARNSREIQRNPARFVRHLLGMLPQMMFVLLPIFAAVVMILYLFSGRYYIEHLILQVHNHAFLFLAMIALIGLSTFAGGFERAEFFASGLLAGTTRLISALIQIWIPLYLFISLKRFYRQGWILTTLKFFSLSIAYQILLMVALTFTAIIGILNL